MKMPFFLLQVLSLTLSLLAGPFVSPKDIFAQETIIPLPFNTKLGTYSTSAWKSDFPGSPFQNGVSEGRVVIVNDLNQKWMRVNYKTYQVGLSKGGAGWPYPIGSHQAIELSYWAMFSPTFEWVKGGKLPGLSGGDGSVKDGNPPTGTNGFSSRIMWRAEGRGEAYVYHMDQPSDYADQLSFGDDFRFPKGVPFQIRQQLKLNTPGQADGGIRVWVTVLGLEEKLVVSREAMRFRTIPGISIDTLLLHTFFGGSSNSWRPKTACYSQFNNIQLRLIDDLETELIELE